MRADRITTILESLNDATIAYLMLWSAVGQNFNNEGFLSASIP